MAHVIDYDPLTGDSMTFEYDHANDKFIIGYHSDHDRLEQLADRNRVLRDNPNKLPDDYLDHYARIPTTVQYEWLFKYGVNFNDRNHRSKWMAMLEWPEYRMWKTTNRVAKVK